MKAGPKRQLDAAPLDLSMLPAEGGARAVAFVETFLRIPKGRGAGQLVRLRPWQAEVVHGLYDDPRPTFDSAVIEQNAAIAKGKTADLQSLVAKGQTWQVEKEPRAE